MQRFFCAQNPAHHPPCRLHKNGYICLKIPTMQFLEKRAHLLLQSQHSLQEKLTHICQLLVDEVEYCNWVGFYFHAPNTEELHLGPYVGEPTEHTVIPFGRGICGQVAQNGKTFVVPDVQQQDNYLSCSSATVAEIVVPLFKDGTLVGQIDIDSHHINPFTTEDVQFLEQLMQKVSQHL